MSLLALVSSFGNTVLDRPAVNLALLAVQYLAVAALVALALPLEIAAVKLVSGLIACGILGLSAGGAEPAFAPWRLRLAAASATAIAAIGIAASNWLAIPGMQPQALFGATVLLALGFLQLGLSTSELKVCVALMTVLSGFEIAYSAIEPALAVMALLGAVHIGLAMVVSYLTRIAEVHTD